MTIIIILVLMVLFVAVFLFPKRERFVEREVIGRGEQLASMQEMARSYRCGHFAKHGVRSCGRAPGRPCVRGCRGRLDIDIDWKGN